MRICSLVPGATEVVAALGLTDQLVGISHECDFPSTVRHAPIMVETNVGKGQALSAEIDRQVKELVSAGQNLYRLDEQAFLQTQPDLILTQALCHVCAVTPDQLTRTIQLLKHPTYVVTLNSTTLEGVIHDIERIAKAVGQLAKGQALANSLRRRLDFVHERTIAIMPRPRVVCIEWLDPLYVAGHWVPEMVELAGGYNVLGSKDTPSYETTWRDVEAAHPDIVLVMPCGYSINRTTQELLRAGQAPNEWRHARDRWPQTYVVDAASYFNRPGPRLIDGVELLAAILHPDRNYPIDSTRATKFGTTSSAMDATS